MSFAPHRLVSKLVPHPELATLSVLDAALKQAICALLAQHPDVGSEGEGSATSTASTIIAWAWDLRALLRRYRATLSREHCRVRSDDPF